MLRWSGIPSPIGPLGVATTADGLVAIRFGGPPGPVDGPPPDDVKDQLDGYFAGTLTSFTLTRAQPKGSDFERAVWERIAAIPYGETVTYGRIAAQVGEPDAARAVGVACNRNPVPIVVPCHRVVGAGNKLVGFGGGLPRKRHLLELEARVWIEQSFRSG